MSTIALVGNPNSGKSSLFNLLTGLRQKTGNYPGVTVEKRTGQITLPDGQTVRLIDLPGAYSLYPNAEDERVVLNILSNLKNPLFPDLIVFVADSTQLDRQLLLLSQILDLRIPVVLALTMEDAAAEAGISVYHDILSSQYLLPVISINGRTGAGVPQLMTEINHLLKDTPQPSARPFYTPTALERKVIDELKPVLKIENDYNVLLIAHHFVKLGFIADEDRPVIRKILKNHNFSSTQLQIEETLTRFDLLQPVFNKAVKQTRQTPASKTDKIDRIVTHAVFGPLIFITLMLLTFQAIFAWAQYPMDWIESGFGALSAFLKNTLPEGWICDLLTDGILAGLSGVLVFIPQIAILFLLISLLEEVGYMSRAVYIFDKLMQKFGLNGRSMVSLIAGGACAIPAIMSTRTISNWKERMITIMVTPLISCSARIPVYILLISFAIPPTLLWGIINQQTFVFFGLYLFSTLIALLIALVFSKILKTKDHSYLALELPDYRLPHWRNVALTVLSKVGSFVTEAGKIILMVSVVLWAITRFGPGDAITQSTGQARIEATTAGMDSLQTDAHIAARNLQASYAGKFGKWIEPAIAPLGFDWKIGIALLTSFAAREVFVGTMATIYSLNDNEDTKTIKQKMKGDINPDTGKPVFTIATSLSLLMFYVFAMQCMSTIAVVKRETKSWKWPMLQLAYMSVLAYLASFMVYQIFK